MCIYTINDHVECFRLNQSDRPLCISDGLVLLVIVLQLNSNLFQHDAYGKDIKKGLWLPLTKKISQTGSHRRKPCSLDVLGLLCEHTLGKRHM